MPPTTAAPGDVEVAGVSSRRQDIDLLLLFDKDAAAAAATDDDDDDDGACTIISP